MAYMLTATTHEPFDEVVTATINALEEEGFGVLCDIDVRERLKQKLDIDIKQYRILGACNPQLAHEGLEEQSELGALLPCNVIVYESDDSVIRSAVDPGQLVSITENPALDSIAEDVHERFERVLETVGDALKGTVMEALHMGQVTIDFVVDNPGEWLFHCHNIYHLDGGMARIIKYDD